MKKCTKCNQVKNTTDFDKDRSTCKVCRNEQRQQRPKKLYKVSVEVKVCTKCKIEKNKSHFNIDSYRTDGLHCYCNECRSQSNANNYVQKSEIKKKQTNDHYHNVLKGTEEFNKKRQVKQKEREGSDLFFKLKRRLRNRLYYSLKAKSWRKNNNFVEYIGCDQDTLVNHLASQFVPGMTWGNYGQWHIDHIIPLVSAQSEEEMYKLCHYTNLQPLWALDNIKKGDSQ